MAHLGHRVMDPMVWAEPVGAREEIRLENRLQHQLQGRLDHPVADRADPQATAFGRARFRDQPLPRGQRPEAAVLQCRPQPVKELPDAQPRLDRGGGVPVHPGGLRTLVAPHPVPRDKQERRVGHEVEQVVEPAMRIIDSPTVQLGLNPQYPVLRRKSGGLQLVGIHQRPPGIPASSLLTCWPPSPCARLSRARTTTGPPPHQRPSAGIEPARHRTGLPGGRATADGSHVHCVPVGQVGAQLYPGSIATPTPQAFSVASSPSARTGFGVDPSPRTRSRTAVRPISARLEPEAPLRSFNHWFTCVTPSDLASRTRIVWQCRPVPTLPRLLPALSGDPRIRLPPASPDRCDGPAVEPFHLHPNTQRLVAHPAADASPGRCAPAGTSRCPARCPHVPS